MTNTKDNLGVVIAHDVDQTKKITFTQMLDAEGETIIAEVYYLATGALILAVNTAGTSTLGGLKGEEATVTCDFRSIPVGSGYSIVFRTTANGVLAKAALVVHGNDGFSTEELSGELPDTDPIVVESDSVDLVLTLPGTYIYTGATDATWTLPPLSEHQGDEYKIKNRSSDEDSVLTLDADTTAPDQISDSSIVSSIDIYFGEALKTLIGQTYWEI